MTKREMAEWKLCRRQMMRGIRKYTDQCRILEAVLHRPLRFSQIKLLLNIKPGRLNRLLKELCKMMWIVPRTVPNKALVKFYKLQKGIAIPDRPVPPKNCKIFAVYELSKRGASVLRAHAHLKRSKKAVITNPFPLPEKTAERFGVSKKRLRWILNEAAKAG